MRKSPGLHLYELLHETSVPYSMMVWKNFKNVWHHSWKYNKDNEDTTDEDKDKYNRYKVMRANEIAKLSEEERREWDEMRPRVGEFTRGVKKQPYKESYSVEGMQYYYKALSRWRYFLSSNESRQMFDEIWSSVESDERLTEQMFSSTSARKRKSCASEDDEGENRQPSPRNVMLMPGEDGYEEFLQEQMGYEGFPTPV